MRIDAPREIGMEQATRTNYIYIKDEELRKKYERAAQTALNYLYDSWKIHDYEKFLESQKPENSIPDIAPNGIRYSRDDLKSLESKDYTRDEAIEEMKTWDKYNIVIDWDHYPPNEIIMSGYNMHHTLFENERYKFRLDRVVNYKRIKSHFYDKIMVHIYKIDLPIVDPDLDYTYVAKASYYYRTGSQFVMRYCNLFDENGNELIDETNIKEYLVDSQKKINTI